MNKELKFTETKIKEMADIILDDYFFNEKGVTYRISNDSIQFIKTIHPEEKVVYIKQDNFGRVKIGVSCNSENRNKQLSDTSGLWIEDIYDSQYCTNWSKIENNMHKIFESKRIKGEWFNINPKEAIQELKKQEFKKDDIVNILYEMDFYKLERLYKIVNCGSFWGGELDEDDQFIFNCNEEELKNKIYFELKKMYEVLNKNESNIDTRTKYQDIEDELYSYVKKYFGIFNEKIIFDEFTIEKTSTYDPWAYLNDESYCDRLHLFVIALGDCI